MRTHPRCAVRLLFLLSTACTLLNCVTGAMAQVQTTLVQEGQSRCTICVAERVMAPDQELPGQPSSALRGSPPPATARIGHGSCLVLPENEWRVSRDALGSADRHDPDHSHPDR